MKEAQTKVPDVLTMKICGSEFTFTWHFIVDNATLCTLIITFCPTTFKIVQYHNKQLTKAWEINVFQLQQATFLIICGHQENGTIDKHGFRFSI